jgi:hypothetical protein
MRRAIFLTLVFCFVAAFAMAAEDMPAGEMITVTGTIIDNMCATANANNISEFVKTHTKTCALAPDCVASGYSILSSGVDAKLTRFDSGSNAKVAEFLQKPESALNIVAVVKQNGEEFTLVSIENNPGTQIPEPPAPEPQTAGP